MINNCPFCKTELNMFDGHHITDSFIQIVCGKCDDFWVNYEDKKLNSIFFIINNCMVGNYYIGNNTIISENYSNIDDFRFNSGNIALPLVNWYYFSKESLSKQFKVILTFI